MSIKKELFQEGLKNRREVLGETYVNQTLQRGSSEYIFPAQQLVTE
jgi:4-carboxymuconolactone decarboxylase